MSGADVPRNKILVGDVLDRLRELPDCCVQTVVTSPPYWGLRDYGVEGQIGLEPTPDEYVARMVAVFREVRRVLRDDGTAWVNLGDSYANDEKWGGATGGKHAKGLHGEPVGRSRRRTGLKPKDLCGIPWRVAFALQDDGWYLRADIVWSKPNPMPESVTDRPTRAHEYIFLLSKRARYYYDAAAIMDPVSPNTHLRVAQDIASQHGSLRANGGTRADRPMKAVLRKPGVTPKSAEPGHGIKANESWHAATFGPVSTRNKRSVWTVATHPGRDAHFATFPPKLIEPCILAGSRPGDLVLDPFGGSGTTALVAQQWQRDWLLIELNAAYVEMAQRRLAVVPVRLFAEGATA